MVKRIAESTDILERIHVSFSVQAHDQRLKKVLRGNAEVLGGDAIGFINQVDPAAPVQEEQLKIHLEVHSDERERKHHATVDDEQMQTFRQAISPASQILDKMI